MGAIHVNTNLIKRSLWKKFADKRYRDAYVWSQIATNIASQLLGIRELRGWTQQQLAKRANMAQARISLMESPNYENFNLATLRRLASALDIALVVRFVPFSHALDWAVNLSPQVLAAQDYAHDPYHAQLEVHTHIEIQDEKTVGLGKSQVVEAKATEAAIKAEPPLSHTHAVRSKRHPPMRWR